MSSNQRIGFGKKIRLCWLQRALEHRMDGRSFEDCKADLSALVASTNSGSEAIRKILSVLRQVMFDESVHEKSFYQEAVEIAKEAPAMQRLVCYGLSLVAYSFFHSTVEAIGRLARVQGEFTVADLARRLKEREGDRAFVQRVTRYNISSLLDWELIQCDKADSNYSICDPFLLTEDHSVAWIIECHLRGMKKTFEMVQVNNLPALYPFTWKPSSFAQIAKANRRIDHVRIGPQEERLRLTSW